MIPICQLVTAMPVRGVDRDVSHAVENLRIYGAVPYERQSASSSAGGDEFAKHCARSYSYSFLFTSSRGFIFLNARNSCGHIERRASDCVARESFISKIPKPPCYAVVFTSINADVDHTELLKLFEFM